MKKILKAQKVARDPLRHVYWTCPARGCSAYASETEDVLPNKQITCSFCGLIYTVLTVTGETLVSARLLIEAGDTRNGSY